MSAIEAFSFNAMVISGAFLLGVYVYYQVYLPWQSKSAQKGDAPKSAAAVGRYVDVKYEELGDDVKNFEKFIQEETGVEVKFKSKPSVQSLLYVFLHAKKRKALVSKEEEKPQAPKAEEPKKKKEDVPNEKPIQETQEKETPEEQKISFKKKN